VTELRGREAEIAAISALLDGARSGTSGALVLRGEAGIGKSALLDHAAGAGTARVLRGMGVEGEAELPFAGLHMLLRPALTCLEALPGPQRTALEAALGLGSGDGRDPMLVGLAVLSLLTEYADGGLLCLVDDAQWLDRASRDALLFAARRLQAEGVVIIFAVREGEGSFPAAGLNELRLGGLSPEASAALLDEQGLAPAVRYRLLAEAQGNPLALLELATAVGSERHGSFSPGAIPLTGRLQLAFHGQVSRMPEAVQALLLVVAADETGEVPVILRAAEAVGAGIDELAAAEEAGLIRRGGDESTIGFRHPLIRAAVYQRAPLGQRLNVHRALAAALDVPEHADRRAWHLAAAAAGPDEEAAEALERTAARARERSGHEAAAAAYERAARLSVTPEARAHRETLAAEAALESGELDRAKELASRASRRVEGEPAVRAKLAHVQGLADFWQGSFPSAYRLLIEGAELITAEDPGQAAAMLVQALHPAWYLGEDPLSETLDRLARVPLASGDPLVPASAFLARLLDRGRARAAPPVLSDAFRESRRRGRVPDQVLTLMCGAALARGQDADAHELASALAAEHRQAGAAGRLPTALFFVAEGEVFTGRHRDALTTATEALGLARDTGQQQWFGQFSSVLAYLHAVEGDEEACRRQADAGMAGATAGSIAPGAPWAHWSLGLLELGLGRAEAALSRFERLTREPMRHHICATRSTPDLVEAAVRVGAAERTAEAMERFEEWAASVRRPWADALVLRCRALLGRDDQAERLYSDALKAHDRDGRPLEYARTALLYGEWLRRAQRKAEARVQLNEALETFDRLGMRPWAERARGELTATGAPDTRAKPTQGTAAGLTPQELQIVRLASQGLSNRDIAAQLFLSHRTVAYHLYKAYPKLGITSRRELKDLAARMDI
jgi:DNA-binding CsgD family transcriptional regulator